MINDGVPEKEAWVLVRDDRVLVTRNHGRELFYLPGGKREPGESDSQTLAREIRHRVSAVDAMVFDALHESGRLP